MRPPIPERPQRARAGSDQRVLAAIRAQAREDEVTLQVVGDCMAPLVASGASVSIRAARFYWPGDVVAFISRAGEPTLHRIVGYRWRRGGLAAVTMPDHQAQPDASIPLASLLGRLAGGDCDRRAVAVPWKDRARALGRFARAVVERIGR